MVADASSQHSDGASHPRGALLFPAMGVLTGLTAFLALYLFWPSARPDLGALGGSSAAGVQAQSSGGSSSGPAPVGNLGAVAGDGAATISWTAPTGVQAVQYTVQAIPENTALPVVQCATAALSCALGGMTDGATYTVEVGAKDAAGLTGPVTQAQVTPYPAVLGSGATALWLNADDVPGAIGVPVSQWPDESGQHNGATQSVRAAEPVLAALGSHHALEFSGTQNLGLDGGRLPSGTVGSEVFAVVELQDPGAATSCFEHVIAWGAPQTGAARMIYKGCGTQLAYADTFNTYPLMQPAVNWPQGRPSLVAAAFTPSGVTVRMDGSADYTWPRPSDTPGSTGSQKAAMVGGAPWWVTRNGWKGLIGEVIVLSGQVSAGDEQAVEKYLIRKWDVPTP